MIKPHPARPKFSLGQRVSYVDRYKRQQVGEVLNIGANWSIHQKGGREHATIIYTVTHPTFHSGFATLQQDQMREAEEWPSQQR